jgi:hypothetical protein
LDIGDDVLLAARELARKQRTSIGQVLTELARKGLQHRENPSRASDEFLGFQPLPPRGVVVTNELINRLREEDGE